MTTPRTRSTAGSGKNVRSGIYFLPRSKTHGKCQSLRSGHVPSSRGPAPRSSNGSRAVSRKPTSRASATIAEGPRALSEPAAHVEYVAVVAVGNTLLGEETVERVVVVLAEEDDLGAELVDERVDVRGPYAAWLDVELRVRVVVGQSEVRLELQRADGRCHRLIERGNELLAIRLAGLGERSPHHLLDVPLEPGEDRIERQRLDDGPGILAGAQLRAGSFHTRLVLVAQGDEDVVRPVVSQAEHEIDSGSRVGRDEHVEAGEWSGIRGVLANGDTHVTVLLSGTLFRCLCLTLGTASRTVKAPRCRRGPPAQLAGERPGLRRHDRAVAGRSPRVAACEHAGRTHASHHRSTVIEDPGSHGCRAGDALGVRDGVPAPAHPLAIRVEPGGPCPRRSRRLWEEREDRFSAGAQVQRSLRADLHGLADGIAALDLLGVDADGAAQKAERRGLPGALADRLQVGQRAAAKIVVRGGGTCEEQHLCAQAVPARRGIDRDVAGLDERDEDAMDDALRVTEAPRGLGHAEIVSRLRELVEHLGNATRDRRSLCSACGPRNARGHRSASRPRIAATHLTCWR